MNRSRGRSRHLSTTTLLSLALLSSDTIFSVSAASYKWPLPQYDLLESLLYEGRREDGSSLSALVHPCKKRGTGPVSIAAEWLRTAFHDMVTHDISAGTGGLDGSIAYELDRIENFGAGFTDTMSDYVLFPNKYISRSDVIALGAIFATSTCGGPIIPFRGNRVDAYTAGPPGVPEPQDLIDSIVGRFEGAGFTQAELIQLTACGHTVGGVRSTDFPDMVAPGPGNALVIQNFDATNQFDDAVVAHYLDGTTENPLVITSNVTMASDFKIFNSDGNATVKAMAGEDAFNSACQAVLARMIDTVPSNVQLTDEIALLPEKVWGALITVERGIMVFKTNFRLTQAIDSTVSSTRVVTLYWCDRYGSNAGCSSTHSSAPSAKKLDEKNLSPVSQAMNITFSTYSFVVPIEPGKSVQKFWFTVDDQGDGRDAKKVDNGGDGYVLDQDQVLFIPTLSTWRLKATDDDHPGPSTSTTAPGQSFTLPVESPIPAGDDSDASRDNGAAAARRAYYAKRYGSHYRRNSSAEGSFHKRTLEKRGGEASGGRINSYNLTVAVRNGSAKPSRVYGQFYDNAINKYPSPLNTTLDFTLGAPVFTSSASNPNALSGEDLQANFTSLGYTLYTATIDDMGQYLTFDLYADIDGTTYAQDFRQTSFLDNTPYLKPTEVQVSKNAAAAGLGESSRTMILAIVVAVVGVIIGMN